MTHQERFSWRRLLHMVRKELRQLVRDPKARPILFVAPIIQMILLGYAATTDVRSIRTVVADHDRTAESRALVDAYQTSGYFIVVAHTDRAADVVSALERNFATVGLTIPPGFARDLRGGRGAVVQAVIDGADASLATVAQSYANQVAGRFGARLVAPSGGTALGRTPAGVELRARAWFNPGLESRFFNVPAVMGVLLMMVCLLLTSLAVVREREIGTLDQLLVSPIRPAELILGKTVPVLLVAAIHLPIHLSLAVFHFGVPLRGALAALLLAAALYVVAGIALGLLISTVSRTQQEAFMLLILFFVPAVVLSGFLSPIDGMPASLRWLTAVNPLRYFLEIIRGVFLKGLGVRELWTQYAALAAMSAVTLLLATRRFSRAIA